MLNAIVIIIIIVALCMGYEWFNLIVQYEAIFNPHNIDGD